MSIAVNQLTKIYGTQKATDKVSFRVDKGEIVGFLGPNGAGKSTTMKLITGYLLPDEGSTIVSGINVQQEPLEAKRKIGYLPEANPLYHDMFVREYLGFIADAHSIANKKKRINDIIETVGLSSESGKRTGQLSKGYKQRVGLAAALLHDPEVLILDEPTTGLDPNQIIEIRELIRRLGQNKTVLFSSHILQEVEALCKRVVIINKGRIVADDNLQNLQKQSTGSQYVQVVFQGSPPTEILQGLHEVAKMEMIDPAQFRFYTESAELLRKELLELSLRHNLNIVSLQSGEQSLEGIFRELTSSPSDINNKT
jgi:ABC-2 type transport system ATP-binding protein